jgi:hypothetical protein
VLVLLPDLLDHHIKFSLVIIFDCHLSPASQFIDLPLSDQPILSSNFICLVSNRPKCTMAEDTLDGTLVHMSIFPQYLGKRLEGS